MSFGLGLISDIGMKLGNQSDSYNLIFSSTVDTVQRLPDDIITKEFI